MNVIANLQNNITDALVGAHDKFCITFPDSESTKDHLQVGSILFDADGRTMIITHYSVDEMLAECID